jgi:hypothetical protein
MLWIILLACAAPTPSTSTSDLTLGTRELTLNWTPDPQKVGEQSLEIQGLAEGDVLEIAAMMPAHDHGAPDIVLGALDNGSQTATWTWSMAGAWVVTFSIGEESEELEVEVQ